MDIFEWWWRRRRRSWRRLWKPNLFLEVFKEWYPFHRFPSTRIHKRVRIQVLTKINIYILKKKQTKRNALSSDNQNDHNFLPSSNQIQIQTLLDYPRRIPSSFPQFPFSKSIIIFTKKKKRKEIKTSNKKKRKWSIGVEIAKKRSKIWKYIYTHTYICINICMCIYINIRKLSIWVYFLPWSGYAANFFLFGDFSGLNLWI